MQLEFFDVPSPCIGICQADDKGHCLGCMRTRDERLNWSGFNHDDKQKVIKRCLQRKKRKLNQSTAKEVHQPEEENIQPSLFESPTAISENNAVNSSVPDDGLDFGDFEL